MFFHHQFQDETDNVSSQKCLKLPEKFAQLKLFDEMIHHQYIKIQTLDGPGTVAISGKNEKRVPNFPDCYTFPSMKYCPDINFKCDIQGMLVKGK